MGFLFVWNMLAECFDLYMTGYFVLPLGSSQFLSSYYPRCLWRLYFGVRLCVFLVVLHDCMSLCISWYDLCAVFSGYHGTCAPGPRPLGEHAGAQHRLRDAGGSLRPGTRRRRPPSGQHHRYSFPSPPLRTRGAAAATM